MEIRGEGLCRHVEEFLQDTSAPAHLDILADVDQVNNASIQYTDQRAVVAPLHARISRGCVVEQAAQRTSWYDLMGPMAFAK